MRDTRHQTPLDRALAALAARQHGVVSLAQLLDLGLSKSAVTNRVAAGRLHRVHRGVYSVGHRLLTREGRWMAAVLACGEGALLSHHSAAELWGVVRPSSRILVDVTSPRRTGRKKSRIRVHDGRSLRPQDVTSRQGIPCTSVARTLLDLAEIETQSATNRAVEKAEARELFHLLAINELLARSAGRRGAPRLQQAIAHHVETITRSEMEDAMLAICENANLPRPGRNVWMPEFGYEVDFMWRSHRLIVEADSREHHGTSPARERDYRRDRVLRNAKWRVERFSYREIVHAPRTVAEALKPLLSAAA